MPPINALEQAGPGSWVRAIDLTMPIADGMAAFPGEPTARFTAFSSVDGDTGIEMWNVGLFSQLGTHLDAPRHFIPGGDTVDTLDLERCVGSATVVDHRMSAGPIIDVEHLRPYEDSLRRTRRALIRTGWDAHIGSPQYWTDSPELSVEAASYLVEVGAVFLGLDIPTPSFTHLHEVHHILLGAHVVITECLVNLDCLNPETWIACLPLPLVGLDGSPVRAIALQPG